MVDESEGFIEKLVEFEMTMMMEDVLRGSSKLALACPEQPQSETP